MISIGSSQQALELDFLAKSYSACEFSVGGHKQTAASSLLRWGRNVRQSATAWSKLKTQRRPAASTHRNPAFLAAVQPFGHCHNPTTRRSTRVDTKD
jgi:hypothetical protein